MDLRDLLHALRRRKLLLSAGALAGIALGLAVALTGSTAYRASATLLVTDSVGPTSDPFESQQRLNVLAFTYAEVITSDEFLRGALASSDPDGEATVTAEVVKNTPVIDVGVSAPSAEVATEGATELVASLTKGSVDVLAGSTASAEVRAISLSEGRRESSNALFILLATFVAGLLIAGMFALLVETQ